MSLQASHKGTQASMSQSDENKPKLGYNRYGKSKVRVMKINRPDPARPLWQDVKEATVQVLLEGAFDESFITGDNTAVIPTDTVKNTVYVLSKTHTLNSIEDFSVSIARHFLNRYTHVTGVHVIIEEQHWSRLRVTSEIGGTSKKPHAHAFMKKNPYVRYCSLYASRTKKLHLEAGLYDLTIMKSTNSGFTDFWKDEYTTLQPTSDRMMRTCMYTKWTFSPNWLSEMYNPLTLKANKDSETVISKRFTEIFNQSIDIFFHHFAGEPEAGIYSPSVQLTLYDMGCSVLKYVPEVETIFLSLPNLHCWKFDMSKFGLDNKNEVFYPTEDPRGQIEAFVTRSSLQSEKNREREHTVFQTISKM